MSKMAQSEAGGCTHQLMHYQLITYPTSPSPPRPVLTTEDARNRVNRLDRGCMWLRKGQRGGENVAGGGE